MPPGSQVEKWDVFFLKKEDEEEGRSTDVFLVLRTQVMISF